MPTLLDKIVAYSLYGFLAVLMGWVITIIFVFHNYSDSYPLNLSANF